MALSKALFLDRDGVINIDHGYVYRADDMEFVPGIFALCQRFKRRGYKLVVVTNQSGIGRGYYTEADFLALTDWMKRVFAEHQVPLDAVYFCPHHPDNALSEFKIRCDCRKPQPGMLLKAQQQLNLDMAESVMVGDKLSDMQAARKAAVGRTVLLLTGKELSAEELGGDQQVSCLNEIQP